MNLSEERLMNYLSDKRLLCELVGTAALILVGCGAIAIGGFGTALPVGILPIALAFGLTVIWRWPTRSDRCPVATSIRP